MARVLVTGHRGFIGGYLYKKLIDLGYEVYGFDVVDGDDLLNFNKIEEAEVQISQDEISESQLLQL